MELPVAQQGKRCVCGPASADVESGRTLPVHRQLRHSQIASRMDGYVQVLPWALGVRTLPGKPSPHSQYDKPGKETIHPPDAKESAGYTPLRVRECTTC